MDCFLHIHHLPFTAKKEWKTRGGDDWGWIRIRIDAVYAKMAKMELGTILMYKSVAISTFKFSRSQDFNMKRITLIVSFLFICLLILGVPIGQFVARNLKFVYKYSVQHILGQSESRKYVNKRDLNFEKDVNLITFEFKYHYENYNLRSI